MKILYKNTLEDVIEGNLDTRKESILYRTNLRKSIISHIAYTIVISLISLFPFILKKNCLNLIIFISVAVGFTAYTLIYFKREPKRKRKELLSFYKDKDISEFICEHSMFITEEGIVEKSNNNESKKNWEGVKKIITAEDRTYVFLDDIHLHIIPKNGIIEGNYAEFVNTLKLKYNNSLK